MSNSPFEFRFWGVRGSIPCAGRDFDKFGGNTSCISVRIGESWIVLDAGTGIRALGKYFLQHRIFSFHLFLSHTHWDHICGFPFFEPVFDERFHFSVFCGRLSEWSRPPIRNVIAGQMMTPLFPVPLEMIRAKVDWQDFPVRQSLDLVKGAEVLTTPLNHPSGSTACRINYGGRSFCYVTDTEHVAGCDDENVLQLIEGADAVVYDATYEESEYASRQGWGHSTWEEGVRLCKLAGVRQLFLFHHDNDRDDQRMAEMERSVRRVWSGALAAREGMRVSLC